MGTPDFSVGTLEEIIKAGHEVVLVVSQPDKAVGRSKALKYTPVKECAIAHGIEVYQPERVRDSACIEYLKSFHADIMIVVAFGQIIPKAVLDMPKYGCVNVHASLLPNIVAQHRSSGLSSTAIRIPECPHSAWTKVLIREISF